MSDPLTQVVGLLQPQARFSKVVGAAGPWRVRRTETGQPFYCVILDGLCRLEVDGQPAITLEPGDFVLIPASARFTMSSLVAPDLAQPDVAPLALANGEFRHGAHDAPPDVRFLVGYCSFGSPDAALLVSLLPQLVHVRGEPRLSTLVQLVGDESRAARPGRDVILARLLEVLLIEALRCAAKSAPAPGLLRGLADERLAVALRRIHDDMSAPWTVEQLAKESALSRSAFFERFSRAMGLTPIAYRLAWRMAFAKTLLRHQETGIAEVAARTGYGSASAFSIAFTRHVGMPPARYARAGMESHQP